MMQGTYVFDAIECVYAMDSCSLGIHASTLNATEKHSSRHMANDIYVQNDILLLKVRHV